MRGTSTSDAGSDDLEMSDLECGIEAPWALMRNLQPPADTFSAHLRWGKVPAVLSLSRFRLNAEELNQIEPGGAVVLPQSLLPGWHGTLCSEQESGSPGSGVPVALASPLAPRIVSAHAGHNTPDETDPGAAFIDFGAISPDRCRDARQLCEVRLATPNDYPCDQLAGWFEHKLTGVGPHASLWRCATTAQPAMCLASGQLMPWGDGWAMAIEVV